MDELKPCPFCGQTGELVQDGQWFYVECNNAYCLKADLGESGAVLAWNTRPIEDAIRAERDEMLSRLNVLYLYTAQPGSPPPGDLITGIGFNFTALRAENQRLCEERRWIPVGERLPETSGQYIACWQGREERHVAERFYSARLKQWDLIDHIPTHWMPLPEPPTALAGEEAQP